MVNHCIVACKRRSLAGFCCLSLAFAGTITSANDLEWKYNTSGRVEGSTTEQSLILLDSVSMMLPFYAWSAGFDIDTKLGFIVSLH